MAEESVVLVGVLVVGAYLLGTFPTAELVARAHGHDVKSEGSGNPGASNVYRIAGRTAAIVVFLGDAAKAMIATAAGLALSGRPVATACAAAAVVGHCYPANRGFRGGKGVATAFGSVLVMHPVITTGLGVGWLVLVRLTGKASIASIIVVVAAPIAIAVAGDPLWEVAAVTALSAFIVARHRNNIARLMRGEERSLRVEGS